MRLASSRYFLADCSAIAGKARVRPVLLVAAAALWLLVGSGHGPGRAEAQNACSSGCRAAYGACYKSTHDRSRCQAQLQHCLEGCIRMRHSTHKGFVPEHGIPGIRFGRGPIPFGHAPGRWAKFLR
jgi:hypothetical protein